MYTYNLLHNKIKLNNKKCLLTQKKTTIQFHKGLIWRLAQVKASQSLFVIFSLIFIIIIVILLVLR